MIGRGHGPPLVVLTILDLLMLRNLLLKSGPPASIDSGFTYSLLPFFAQHDIHLFTGWLSWPLGQVQHYSAYWLLAAIQAVIHNPVLLYKLAILATVLVASVGAYGFAYWLSRSRLGAGVASALYVFAPFSVAAWLAGHLDVAISYAVGPIAIWALWVALRTGSRLAMAVLGLSGSALYLLTVGQGAYWLLPMCAVLGVELLRARRSASSWQKVRRRLGLTAAISLSVFAVSSAVQLVPLAAGVKAPFVEGGTHYYIEDLSVHAKYSLSIFDNVLGVPREVWLTNGTSIAASPFSSVSFRIVAFALLAIALIAPLRRPSRTALVLMGSTVVAWLLASGPDGPLHPIYLFFYDHVPYFKLLRAPNRWLMVSTLGLSMLTALTIGGLKGRPPTKTWLGFERDPGTRVAIWAICLAGFSGAYALFHGLPTWQPPANYAKAYSPLRADRSDWRILTTPFFQTWMRSGSQYGTDLTVAADLGQTSSLWHGHSSLGRGGWDPRAGRFATYLYELTEQGTSRNITKLLGAAGVKYIGLNPHAAREVVGGQNAFFRRQSGLEPFSHSGNVAVYKNRYALPQAFLARDSCVIAGGFPVLGDLAEQRYFRFDRVGLRFADQIFAVGGRDALRRAIGTASCLIVAPGGKDALTVLLGSDDTVDVSPIAPSSWARAETSPSLDIGAEPSTAVLVPPAEKVSASIRANDSGTYEVWVAALRAVDQRPLGLTIDGKSVGPLNLSATTGAGIRWIRSAPMTLARGRHAFELTNTASPLGLDAELTKVALVNTSAAARSIPPTTATVIDERGGAGPIDIGPVQRGRSLVGSRWRLNHAAGFAKIAPRPGSRLDLQVVRSNRRYFTLARAEAAGGMNAAHPFAIRFRGTGSGRAFYLNTLFDTPGRHFAGFRFVDSTRGERTLVFSPLSPSSASSVPSWSSVKAFTISTNSKAAWRHGISIEGPYELPSLNLTPSFRAQSKPGYPFPRGTGGGYAVDSLDQMVNDRVKLASYLDRGLLVFTQAYHPMWQLNGTGGQADHTVALGFANAYSLNEPVQHGSLKFVGAGYARTGMGISLLAWALALAFAARIFATRKSRDFFKQWGGGET